MNAGSEVTGDFGTLRAEVDMIDVTSALPYADESWTYTDQQGHRHRYGKGYPTLTWIVDERYWDEGLGEEVEDGHWECPLCGEPITPGTQVDYSKRYIPGMTHYYLNDEEISEADYQRVAAQITQRGSR